MSEPARITFSAQHQEQHSRLATFFRLLLIIPHAIVLAFVAIAAFLTLIVAWFAVVITGRYPSGLWNFHKAFLNLSTHFSGYVYLLTDRFPPFWEDASYPVQLHIPDQPPAEQSRLLALVRAIFYIPVYVIAYALTIVAFVGAFIAWFVEVLTGRLPKGLHDMIVLGLSYGQRSTAYLFLMSDQFPPFQAEGPVLAAGGGAGYGGGTLAPPVGSTAPVGSSPEAPTAPAVAPPPSAPPSASERRPDGPTSGDPLNP